MERFARLTDGVDLEGHGFDADEIDEYAASILKEWGQARDFSSLEAALCILRNVCALRPVGHPHRKYSLNDLALSLVIKFVWTGGVAASDEAIDVSEGGWNVE